MEVIRVEGGVEDTDVDTAARELGIDLTASRAYGRMVNGVMELRLGKHVVAYAIEIMPGLWEYITDKETGYVSGDKFGTAQQLASITGLPELAEI